MIKVKKLQIEQTEKILKFFKKLVVADPERGENLEEVSKITVESERSWIKSLLEKEEKKEMISRLVEVDGEIVGLGHVEKLPREIERHVGDIRVGFLPGYEQAGFEMAKALTEDSKSLKITLLMYFHFETQHGIETMKKLGFEQTGLLPKYYKKSGEYINRVYLTKALES